MVRTKETMPTDRPMSQSEWEQAEAEWWARMEELQAVREVLQGKDDE